MAWPPESALLALCRAGDQDAFRRLVEAHHDRVYRTAFAVMADADAAAEVAQETWVRAWRGLRGFRGDAALATWLTRLALNAAADHLRRERARAAHRAVLPFPPQPAVGTSAVDDRDELRRALGWLPSDARQLVGLRFGLGLSVPEIAAVLGCPEGTVKSRLHAATSRLRTAFHTSGAGARARPAEEVR